MVPDIDSHPNVTVESVSPDAYPIRTLLVEFLFLDRDDCDRCRETEESLHEAIDRLALLLVDLDVEIVVRNVHVETEADARRTRLESSPTIRIDGRDVQPAVSESPCDDCSEETGVDCRIWLAGGERHAHAPVELLVDALLRAALSTRRDASVADRDPYRVPENLRTFFEVTDRDHTRGDTETGAEPCCHSNN